MTHYIMNKFSRKGYAGLDEWGRPEYTTDLQRMRTYPTQKYAQVVHSTLPPSDRAECYVAPEAQVKRMSHIIQQP